MNYKEKALQIEEILDEEMPDEIYQVLFLIAVELYRMGGENEKN